MCTGGFVRRAVGEPGDPRPGQGAEACLPRGVGHTHTASLTDCRRGCQVSTEAATEHPGAGDSAPVAILPCLAPKRLHPGCWRSGAESREGTVLRACLSKCGAKVEDSLGRKEDQWPGLGSLMSRCSVSPRCAASPPTTFSFSCSRI